MSVVTVTLNAAASIEETIRSVLFQSYDNVEYVVVDGGSTDGTLDIIKAYGDTIDFWISEPDGGIYQAMNRALSLIGGRYVNFLNADDHYVHAGTLQQVVSAFQTDAPQVVVGSVLMLNKASGYGFIRHNNVNKYYYLFRGLPQQAFFYDASVFETATFDESLPIASDLDFYLGLLLGGKARVKSVPMPVVVFNTGATSSDEERLQRDRERVIRKHFSPLERALLHHRLVEKLLVRNELRPGKPGLVDRVLRKLTRQ